MIAPSLKENLVTTSQLSSPADSAPAETTAFHTLSVGAALAAEGVNEREGLSAEEAAARLATYGPNRFREAEKEPAWRAFVRQYADPMQIVLLVAGIGTIYPLEEYATGVLLIVLTLFNALMGLRQEGKAAAAVAALQKMMILKARVRRGGALLQIAADQLVPGDVVLIEAGEIVCADGRLIHAATLEIAESALTGESVPVSKSIDAVEGVDTDLGDRTDMVYMNTNVTRGSGEFVVTATGMSTEVGHISKMLESEAEAVTPLTKQLKTLTNQILVIAGIAVVLSIVLNLARGDSRDEVFIAAIAFAVSAIPTGLPAVLTTILSMGTTTLAKANAIVKRLRATETLGCTSAINSDKTGTLTLNQMTAVEMAIPGRRYTISGSGYSTEGTIKRTAGDPEVPLEPFLQPMILASDAVVTDGELVGDPTEGALVVLAEKGGIDAATTREKYPRAAELPFDAAYKFMATFHRMTDESGTEVVRCFVKGAPDQLLARASMTLDVNMRPAPVDDDFHTRYLGENQRLGEQGLRVMATGRKDFDASTFDPGADLLQLVDGITLLNLVGIMDPPRSQAKAAIAKAKAAGMQVRMITGDHAVTAKAIARKLGIEGRAITGAEFGNMSDEELVQAIDGVGVIARVTPEHKVRLVDVLKSKGHVVAMTGDGVNDAPALKKADIGIAMGITGTEVSKEAAAMILTDDDFATIVRAVELGRGLYDNLKNYVVFQMGALLGFIYTFLGASIFNVAGGVPFVPLQTLWVNFTTQVSQAVGLGFGKPADDIMQRKPRRPDEPILPRDVLIWLAIAGLVMGGGTLGVIAWADTSHAVELGRTMGLTTFAIANVVFSFTVRDKVRSVFRHETLEDHRFLLASGLSLVSIIFAAETRLGNRLLNTVNLSFNQWVICVLVGSAILIVSEIYKAILRSRTHEEGPSDSVIDLATEAA
jgi:Ca2+-transporting ATPase